MKTRKRNRDMLRVEGGIGDRQVLVVSWICFLCVGIAITLFIFNPRYSLEFAYKCLLKVITWILNFFLFSSALAFKLALLPLVGQRRKIEKFLGGWDQALGSRAAILQRPLKLIPLHSVSCSGVDGWVVTLWCNYVVVGAWAVGIYLNLIRGTWPGINQSQYSFCWVKV